MQELERAEEDLAQDPRRRGRGRGLGDLDIPVGELVPGKAVDQAHSLGELALLQEPVVLPDGAVELGEDPAVRSRKLVRRPAVPVGDDEPGSVPELGDESPTHLRPLAGVRKVLGRGLVEEAEAHGVGAVLVEKLQGIYGVALRAAHLRPILRQHDGVDVHFVEGDPALETQAHHDHARYPQVHDLACRREEARGVEVPEVLRAFVGPAQGRDGPKTAREPGVEHVRVLLETLTRRLFGGHYLAVRAVPHRDALSPPQLPGDVPIADVLEPPHGLSAPRVGVDPYLLVLEHLDGGLGEGPHRAPPLLREPRLDDGPAAVARSDPEPVVLDLAEKPLLVQTPGHCLSGALPALAREGAAVLVDGSVRVHDVDRLETQALTDLEVVRVVGRRDLENAGPELGIHVLVGEDLDLPRHERHLDPPSDEPLVSLVVRVDYQGYVAEHRLWSGGEDLDVILAVGSRASAVHERVADAVELAVHVLVVDLQVRDGRAVVRAPVGDAVAAVDQAVLVQPDESRQDGVYVLFVHRVPEAAPVQGGAKPLVLAQYLLSRL